MVVEITVRGSAERRYAAEIGTVRLAVEVQGAERAAVAVEATAIHGELTGQLSAWLADGPVRTFAADSVRVLAERPWQPEGGRGDLVQVARLGVQASFDDFEALSGFVGDWSQREGVEISGVEWGVIDANRRSYEAEVRADAVADAVAKAQAYADAVGAGAVRPTHLGDPGMLTSPEPGPRMMKSAMMADSAGGAGLELRPDEITVLAEVDARFLAG